MRDWREEDPPRGTMLDRLIGQVRGWLDRRATPEHVAPIVDRTMATLAMSAQRPVCPWCAGQRVGVMHVSIWHRHDTPLGGYPCPVCESEGSIRVTADHAA